MSRPLGYAHSLDGVRALCLLAVLAYHAGLPIAVGGYLGVSTFFTLSGFLITHLLVSEAEASGRIRLGRFAVRRVQRLLPASLATLAAIALTAPWWIPPAQLERLGGDLLACIAYLINWRFIDEGYAYALLFVAPSEVQHFWSLAIEGQFYLVYPLAIAAATRHRVRPRLLLAGLALLVLGSLAWSAVLFQTAGQERVYFGTDTRLAELGIGALLALLLREAPDADRTPVPQLLDAAGGLALLALGVAWICVPLDTAALYRGGLGVYAVASALVLLGCLRGAGRLRALLSPAPLRYVGRISYGAYLYHWPILIAIDAFAPASLGRPSRLALLLVATLALAALSHHLLEEPVRGRRLASGRRVAGAAGAASLAVAALVLLQFPSLRSDALDLARAGRAAPARADAVRISIFGDSTAIQIGHGFNRWMRDRPDLVQSFSVMRMGCGLLQAYVLQRDPPRSGEERGPCQRFYEDVLRSVERGRPDVSVVLFGPWEVEGYVDPSDGRRHPLGEPEADAVMRDALRSFVDVLASGGGQVVWLDVPPTTGSRETLLDPAARERARREINRELHRLAAERPEQLTIIELSAQLRAQRERGEAPDRPDGTHFSNEAAARLVETWLGPRALEILASARAPAGH